MAKITNKKEKKPAPKLRIGDKDTTNILLQVTELRTDVSAYKAFSPTYVPTVPLLIEIPLSKRHLVREVKRDILTLEGFEGLIVTLANASAEAVEAHNKAHP